MHRHRNCAQFRSGQHHDGQGFALRPVLLRIGFKKLGVARIRKTGGIEIGFVDRRGDKPRAVSKADRIERRAKGGNSDRSGALIQDTRRVVDPADIDNG
jgi:hypothetical protein